MAGEITTNTQNSAVIPEEWPAEVIAGLYDDSSSIVGRILNKSEMVAKAGDIMHIPVAPTLASQSVSQSLGTFTSNQVTLTDATVTINQWEVVALEWLKLTTKQSLDAWWGMLPSESARVLREKLTNYVLSLYATPTLTAEGSGADHASEDMVLAAIQKLITAKVDILERPEDCTFAFADTEYAPLKKQGLLDYSRTGEAGMGGAATIKLPRLYNVPTFISTQVATSAGQRKNLLFHRNTFAIGIQSNMEMEIVSTLPNRVLGKMFAMDLLFGAGGAAAGRGLLINTVNA